MLIRADARSLPLQDACVDCCISSPPYFGLRDYGTARWNGGDLGCDHSTPRTQICGRCGATRQDSQIGLEPSPTDYVEAIVQVYREVRRVLKPQGTVWLNLGDSYAGGGRGGNPEESAFRKQATNRGSLVAPTKVPAGLKAKDLVGIPWRVAFALQADGWYLRSDIIWHKPNPMPESVTDRPTKAHEYLFLLTKSERYYYDADAIAETVSRAMLLEIEQGYQSLGLKDYEGAGVQNASSVKARIIANARLKSAGTPRNDGDRWQCAPLQKGAGGGRGVAPRGFGRNRRSVWTIPTMPYAGAHFATMPEKLVEPCILAGCPMGGLVLDPFSGSGTVLAVAERLSRRGVGVDLNAAYHKLAKLRTAQRGIRFHEESAHAIRS